MNAELCRWCGKTREQHVDSYPQGAPVPRMPCMGLKMYFYKGPQMTKPSDEVEAFKVETKDRVAAVTRLDRWLTDCERAAVLAYDEGRSGYLGRIKICAFVNDEGITLRVESGTTEEL